MLWRIEQQGTLDNRMQPEPNFSVLVVDDEPPICDLLARIAQKQFPEATFINTRSAKETVDYLEQAGERVPNLILLDIDLKQAQGGLDLLPALRSRFEGRVPVIMLSVVDEVATIQQAYESGAVAYTHKPQDVQGWQQYVELLKSYWHKVVRLPTLDPPPEE
jgi:CheY-like chemotaxis protein